MLDGEVAIFDRQLRSRFDWLRDPDPRGEVLQAGFEGYIAKDEASPYVGGVTKSWLKVKVPGWTDPEDRWRRVRLDIEDDVKDTR